MNENDILKLIAEDPWMMERLSLVQTLNLPDWWIGAGFVRGKIWDVLHGYQTRTPLPDIDVIYFDKSVVTKEQEQTYEAYLKNHIPESNWSVKNQARMHEKHGHKPYKTSTQALAQWVETATCVGVQIEGNGELKLTAPRGIDDLVNLILRPTPDHQQDQTKFHERIEKKQWLTKWPKLKVQI